LDVTDQTSSSLVRVARATPLGTIDSMIPMRRGASGGVRAIMAMGRPMGELTATTAIIPAGNLSAAVTAVASLAKPRQSLGALAGPGPHDRSERSSSRRDQPTAEARFRVNKRDWLRSAELTHLKLLGFCLTSLVPPPRPAAPFNHLISAGEELVGSLHRAVRRRLVHERVRSWLEPRTANLWRSLCCSPGRS
jgi:hypothetical protein